MDIIDDAVDGDTYSDAETIPYAEPHRDTGKKDEIYRRKAKKKAIKILNKKRKLNAVADSSHEQDNLSDAETIPYAEPYRGTFTKNDEIYRKKSKRKAIKTLPRKKKTLTKKTKTIKVVEPKENDDLEITGFKSISHPRTRKQLKKAVQSNLGIDLENLVDVPLLFNLRMTSEMEIEDWLVDNLAINNGEYYTEHKQGTNVFRIRKEPDTESNNSEMVLNNITVNMEDFINIPLLFDLNKTYESEIKNWIVKNIPINSKEKYYIEHKKGSNLFTVRNTRTNSETVRGNAFINPEEYLNVPLRFDLDETSESEIEKWIVKSIKYWITRNAVNTRHYIDHADGSNLLIIRRE